MGDGLPWVGCTRGSGIVVCIVWAQLRASGGFGGCRGCWVPACSGSAWRSGSLRELRTHSAASWAIVEAASGGFLSNYRVIALTLPFSLLEACCAIESTLWFRRIGVDCQHAFPTLPATAWPTETRARGYRRYDLRRPHLLCLCMFTCFPLSHSLVGGSRNVPAVLIALMILSICWPVAASLSSLHMATGFEGPLWRDWRSSFSCKLDT